jgi:hypothetical protein
MTIGYQVGLGASDRAGAAEDVRSAVSLFLRTFDLGTAGFSWSTAAKRRLSGVALLQAAPRRQQLA